MYFVNRNEIEEKISHIDTLLNEVTDEQFHRSIELLGLERLIHVVIESIIDVGNLMIDGFIMRDPGSYHDIIDILIDENVIPKADEKGYKSIIDLRQIIVQTYTKVNHDELHDVLNENLEVLTHFSTHIRSYLKNELDVANAFANKTYKGEEL